MTKPYPRPWLHPLVLGLKFKGGRLELHIHIYLIFESDNSVQHKLVFHLDGSHWIFHHYLVPWHHY